MPSHLRVPFGTSIDQLWERPDQRDQGQSLKRRCAKVHSRGTGSDRLHPFLLRGVTLLAVAVASQMEMEMEMEMEMQCRRAAPVSGMDMDTYECSFAIGTMHIVR